MQEQQRRSIWRARLTIKDRYTIYQRAYALRFHLSKTGCRETVAALTLSCAAITRVLQCHTADC